MLWQIISATSPGVSAGASVYKMFIRFSSEFSGWKLNSDPIFNSV